MDARQKQARVAGFVYLLVVLSGIFGLLYVPSKILVEGNAAATAANILAHPTLYNISLVNGIVASLLFLIAVLLLYRLLKDVNREYAGLMVIFLVIQIPFSFVDLTHWQAAQTLVRGADFLTPFSQ